MRYLPHIVKAGYVSGYVVSVKFDDGTEKTIDISRWFKGPVFKPLREKKFFRKFFLDGGGLAWPNGVDIAPESLYEAADIRLGNGGRFEQTRHRNSRSKRSR